MPNIKSAKKRMKTSAESRLRNRSTKSMLKTQVRKVREAVSSGDLAAAETEFRAASRKLDQAGSKKIIHRNAAARTKSRLQKLIKSAKTPAAN